MKYLKQFSIILLISFLGEGLHALIPLPVPASVYGMLLMLLALATGLIPHEAVKDAGHFLIEIMPVMFIPAGVGIMTSLGVLRSVLVPYAVIVVVSTFLVMGVSGLVTQGLLRLEARRKGGKAD